MPFWDYFRVGASLIRHHSRNWDVVAVTVTSKLNNKRFVPFSLDAINFLLADVRGALGPYLNVFLVTQQHWSQSEVGLVTSVGGLLRLAVQTPIGAAIDATRAKRGAIVLALGVLALGAIIIFALPTFWPVMIANSLIAIVGDIFGPAVAALTLGLYLRKQLARRMGRELSLRPCGQCRHRLSGWRGGLCLLAAGRLPAGAVFAMLAAIAVLSIPADAINYDRARDLDRKSGAGKAAGYSILFKSRTCQRSCLE
jgi:hypothetical protein